MWLSATSHGIAVNNIGLGKNFPIYTLKLCKNTKNKEKTWEIYIKCTWLYNAQPGIRFYFPIYFSYARMTSSKEKE